VTRPARPLDRFPLIWSQSAEEMCAALARVYARPQLGPQAQTNKVDATLNLYQMQHVSLGYTTYGIDMSLSYPETDVLLHTFPVRGKGEVTVDNVAKSLDCRCGATISPGMRFSVNLSADYEHFVILMKTHPLADKLAALSGVAINRPLQFEPVRNDTHPAAKALRDHFLFMVDKVDGSATPLPGLLLTEFEQTLMVMALHGNRHNYQHVLQRAPTEVGSWQIRRAEEYIEANWARPITVEDLARITGASGLSLFRSFKAKRGYSPLQFAGRLRLRHARDLLQRGAPGITVAAVAADCGFGNVREFASDYAGAFGETPVQTLKRGRGADGATAH
jgi:AraC-like DNA-binding protein